MNPPYPDPLTGAELQTLREACHLTREELGELAVFFCSAAANNVRGVAWNMDGGWTAQ